MSPDRAYASITSGAVLVGNAWCEREWSHFMGHTIALRRKAPHVEWITKKCPEFRIDAENGPLGVMDLGSVEWSEVYTPFGAGVTARKSNDDLLFVIGAFAFHENPGMLRSTRIMNLSKKPVTVGPVALDILALDLPDARVQTHDFTRQSNAIRWETNERAAAILQGGQGLLLGITGGGVFELFDPEPGLCALVFPESRTLAPGEIWVLPDTYILPFSGDPLVAGMRLFGDFLLLVRQMKGWEREVEAAWKVPQN